MDKTTCFSIGRVGLAALMATGLIGCGGGGSDSGTTGGTTTSTTPVVTSTSPSNATAVNPDQAFKLIDAQGAPVVTVNSPPEVKFAVIDSDGKPVTGLALMDTSAGANLDNCGTGTGSLRYARNVRVAIAKLIPGGTDATTGQKLPDQWQNLIYSTSTTAANGGSASAPLIRATTDPTPSTTNNAPGSSVSYANGVYTYKFSTDVTNASYNTGPMNVDGSANPNQWTSTLSATGASVPAAKVTGGVLTNGKVLTKDGSTTYRIALQLCYMDKGTRVYANPTYDFTVGADGKSVPVTDASKTRKMVDQASCNECHNVLSAHSGSRIDTDYCVVCHNPSTQDKTASPTAGAPANTSVDLKLMVHKIHMGKHLLNGFKVGNTDFTEVGFPQDLRNCTKCHDGSATATHKTPQGDNWKQVPSRAACGACHDGINFATGGGTTLNGVYPGHIAGAQADDSKCALCHSPAAIQVYHIPVTPPYPGNSLLVAGGNAYSNAAWIASNDDNLPAGAIKVSYDIKSVARDSAKHPVMVFRMLQNGVAVPFNDKATRKEIWDNFMGAPSVYFVYAVPQDGIAAPADFNGTASTYLRSLWNGTASGTGAGTLTGPDPSGYCTATITGAIIPDNAVMLTGGLGYTYALSSTPPLTQTNLTAYPMTQSTIDTTKYVGGLIVPAPNVTKVGTGYTGRRAIVDNAKCNLCHEKLGEFTDEAFHGGQRNDGPTCAWCHTPNRTSSGWSADSTNFVHAIHAGDKRTVPFKWHAASSEDNFSKVRFPGILSDCETCHVPGSYDFSAAASSSAVGSRLYRTVATGTLATGISNSPYITVGTNYGTGYSVNSGTGVATEAAATTLVDSPIATACFACHDGEMTNQPGLKVKDHIEQLGLGSIYKPRSTALGRSEQCLLCHGPSSTIAPIKAAHGK